MFGIVFEPTRGRPTLGGKSRLMHVARHEQQHCCSLRWARYQVLGFSQQRNVAVLFDSIDAISMRINDDRLVFILGPLENRPD